MENTFMKIKIENTTYNLNLLDDSFHLIDSSNDKNQYKIPFNSVLYYKKSNCNLKTLSKFDLILVALLIIMPFVLGFSMTIASALVFGLVYYVRYLYSFTIRFYFLDDTEIDMKIFKTKVPKLKVLKFKFSAIEDVCEVEKEIKDKIKLFKRKNKDK